MGALIVILVVVGLIWISPSRDKEYKVTVRKRHGRTETTWKRMK